jgi:hypothetical protein
MTTTAPHTLILDHLSTVEMALQNRNLREALTYLAEIGSPVGSMSYNSFKAIIRVILATVAHTMAQCKTDLDATHKANVLLQEEQQRTTETLNAMCEGYEKCLQIVDNTSTKLEDTTSHINAEKNINSDMSELVTKKEVCTMIETAITNAFSKKLTTTHVPAHTPKPTILDGWSIVQSNGYYKMYKRTGSKVLGIHIGRTWDANKAVQKVEEKLKEQRREQSA